MRLKLVCLALAAMAVSLSAAAQETQKACAAIDKDLPAGFAGWTSPSAMTAASASGQAGAELAIGKSVKAALKPMADIAFPVAPEKAGEAKGHGGLFKFDVMEAATYRIALSAPAWIDVVKDGKTAKSAAHGHGPQCTSIRKIVDFKLEPGAWTLQLSQSPQPEAEVMVVKGE